MLFQADENDRLALLISDQARAWTAEELLFIVNHAAKYKPPGYDKHQIGIRLRYEGKGRGYLDAALVERFPVTHGRMPRVSLNWLKLVASQDAGFYQTALQRTVVGPDDATDDASTELLDGVAGNAGLDGLMPEVERRSLVAKTLFMHTTYDQVRQRPSIAVYWPHDVFVVCHHSAPHDFARCVLLVSRAASPEGPGDKDQWYNVWTRPYVDGDDGQPESFGVWRTHLVSSTGESALAPDDPRTIYEGVFPWACLQIGIPAGCVYVDEDRDLVDVVDALNVSRSSEQYTLDMQGHTPVVYAGHNVESATLVTGPDAVMQVGQGEQLTTLSLDPKLKDMRDGRSLAMRELAITNSNSPDAYSVEPGPPLSGVSRKIANAAHDQKLRERSHTFRAFEEQQLLPILADVHNRFSGGQQFPDGVKFAVQQQQAADFEDPEAKQRRLRDAVDAGWITPARAAVEMGLYSSVSDAAAVGVSDALKGAPAPTPQLQFGRMAPEQPSPAEQAPGDVTEDG